MDGARKESRYRSDRVLWLYPPIKKRMTVSRLSDSGGHRSRTAYGPPSALRPSLSHDQNTARSRLQAIDIRIRQTRTLFTPIKIKTRTEKPFGHATHHMIARTDQPFRAT